ncbi:hypothetical protein C5E16_14770 [Clavibacter michiganensis]|uniref:Uncharacterized protein n=1 Tax=Clavibacter michiganensis TaxID=28447 RepID=A0A2S5VMV4_9MICO|nr:hypothetical protein [Clavibacter michiganensis]PPF64285.1 hypothetical protein C5E16_14770 [Clavibacter michiganensis]
MLAGASAVLAIVQAVVGVLALEVAEGGAELAGMGVALLVSAGISAAVAVLCVVGLRRSR